MGMALRYVLLFGVVLRGMDHPVWAYLAYNQVAASYIFTNFSLSHTHLPVTEADEFVHWVEYAAKHTTNISPSPLCNWWGQPELPGRAPPLPGDAPVPAQAHLAARAGVLRGPRPGVRRAALLLVPAADAREPARRRPLHEGRLMRRF